MKRRFSVGTEGELQVRSENWAKSPIPMSDIEIVIGGVSIPIRSRRQVLFGVVEAFEEIVELKARDIRSTYKLTTRELLDDIEVFVTIREEDCVEICCKFPNGETRVTVPTSVIQCVANGLRSHFENVYSETEA